jgi:hypothetical protein
MDRPAPTRIPGPGVLPRRTETSSVMIGMAVVGALAAAGLVALQIAAWFCS